MLLLTSAAALTRMNWPSRHAEVASSLVALVEDAGGETVHTTFDDYIDGTNDGYIETVGFQARDGMEVLI